MKYLFLALISLFYLGSLSAQVGINNPTPSQALDVGGKIKVGDDQIAPVAGTIRYNRVSKTFEGYDGTEWSVFNPDEMGDGGGVTPPSGTFVTASIGFGGGSPSWTVNWKGATSNLTFENIPSGRTLFVTSIIINSDTRSEVSFRPFSGSGLLTDRDLTVSDEAGSRTQHLHDPNGQLLIIPPSGRLLMTPLSGSGILFLRGILQ